MKEPIQQPKPARSANTMATTQVEAKVLRPSRNGGIVMLLVGVALAAGGGLRMKEVGRFSLPHLIMLFGALVIAAAVEHFATRIVLLPDRLEYGAFRRACIPKEDIESVTWEAGSGVSLRMKSQSWRRIPDLGRAQGVCNSIRAWLKK